jgi:hypothetical protein
MTTFKTIAAAALLSVFAATPVFAQAAIQEPGLFAFYHPYLDVLNGGRTDARGKVGRGTACLDAGLRGKGKRNVCRPPFATLGVLQ